MAEQPAKAAAPATADELEWSPTLNNEQRMSYDDAVKACKKLGKGYRLPTVQELLGTVDYTRQNPAIDIERLPDTKSGPYWSGTPVAWASRAAWVVLFDFGGSVVYFRGYDDAFVRAVRSVPVGQ